VNARVPRRGWASYLQEAKREWPNFFSLLLFAGRFTASCNCGAPGIGIKIENQGEIGARRETEMPRARQFAPLLFLAAVATLFCTQTAAQELKPTGLSQWDSTNQVLFFANCGAGSVVRAYEDGRQRGADIDISKDFPGIQECHADSLTAGPDGTTVIAARLNFGKNRDIREMILTYDSSGTLLKTWDPAPQYVEAIAYSKDDDAVFILGGRDLPDGPSSET
jgi:hypothetical protein